jgi:hypothetical protein
MSLLAKSSRAVAYSRPLSEETKRYLPPAKAAHLVELEQNQGNPLGSKTRGWSVAAPRRGSERHELYDKCGATCFLRPEDEGFPICPACLPDDPNCGGCTPDCRGVASAYVRARQYHYDDIAEQAQSLEAQYACNDEAVVGGNGEEETVATPTPSFTAIVA